MKNLETYLLLILTTILYGHHFWSDKFLIPFLNWGPNNQLRGLQESLILAIKLNRTLCVPFFFKHFTDLSLSDGEEHLVIPRFRIDVRKIHELITTCDVHEIAGNCGGKVDSLLIGRDICSGDIWRTTEETRKRLGLEAFMEEESCRGVKGLPTYPEEKKIVRTLSSDKKWLEEYYPGDERCAVIAYPYTLFPNFHGQIERFLRNRKGAQGEISDFDAEIFSDVINYVARPQFMRALVDDFVKEKLFEGRFIALHYRFDDVDYLSRCSTEDPYKICDDLMKMKGNMTESAEIFVNYLEKLRSEDVPIKAVYLASPPQEVQINFSIKDALRRRFPNQQVVFLDSKDIEPFYNRLANVPTGLKGDVMSSIEQEVCLRARVFLRARPSSWSSNVHIQRVADPETRKFVKDDRLLLDVLTGKST
ncbi:Oidioi.mRNA.OKI2018_I69.chr1.g3817.t1.cds [Oikopleura dioica]|uniref:Oidioi.mRNA.OKI2018_I69.chr1.g3817.t1.cds n=1 Tax=Oikopleura dioica TaxID=34765 RepID=A0ABN7SVB3_OIKDI|nr:Oidioi.mRNA.OKI2018_I69.chr1.g3817.t1.cds [Oikopleura dioica]